MQKNCLSGKTLYYKWEKFKNQLRNIQDSVKDFFARSSYNEINKEKRRFETEKMP